MMNLRAETVPHAWTAPVHDLKSISQETRKGRIKNQNNQNRIGMTIHQKKSEKNAGHEIICHRGDLRCGDRLYLEAMESQDRSRGLQFHLLRAEDYGTIPKYHKGLFNDKWIKCNFELSYKRIMIEQMKIPEKKSRILQYFRLKSYRQCVWDRSSFRLFKTAWQTQTQTKISGSFPGSNN